MLGKRGAGFAFLLFSFNSSDGPELQWMSIKSTQNGVLHTVLISQYERHQHEDFCLSSSYVKHCISEAENELS